MNSCASTGCGPIRTVNRMRVTTRHIKPVMARAAVSLGVAGVFIETHEDPDTAPSDGPNMIPLDQMPAIIASLMTFDTLAKQDPLT